MNSNSFHKSITSRNIYILNSEMIFFTIFSISFHSPYYLPSWFILHFITCIFFSLFLPLYHFHSISTLLFHFILYISFFSMSLILQWSLISRLPLYFILCFYTLYWIFVPLSFNTGFLYSLFMIIKWSPQKYFYFILFHIFDFNKD